MVGSRRMERLPLALACGATVVLGLSARHFLSGSPAAILGTMLYGSLCYLGIRLLRPTGDPRWALGGALAWCWGLELAQLGPLPAWLSSQHLLLRLIFGSTFDPVDLPSYLGGILLVAGADHVWSRSAPGRNPPPQ